MFVKSLLPTSKSLDDHASKLRACLNEREAIIEAFTSRWNVSAPAPNRFPKASCGPSLAMQLAGGRMPWTDGGKAKKRTAESRQVSQRLYELEDAVNSNLNAIARGWENALPVPLPTARLPRLPPGIADSPRLLHKSVPGEGPLVIQVGTLGWEIHAHVPTYSGGGTTQVGSRQVPATNPTQFQVLVDLIRDGGFATDDRGTVESAVVRLLALLPAGTLKIHLFDPLKLGASLPFLNDLNDVTRAAVTGSQVGVVAADLEPMLDELTRHVAKVTQQCLGSQHQTLEAYNTSAGEVAESYHLLVLMDYPTGVQDANGSVDAQILGRLETLIQAGPRCGVFVLVLASHARQSSYTSRYADAAPLAPAGLPTLWPGRHTLFPQLPVLVRDSLPTYPSPGPAPTGVAAVEALLSGDPRRYILPSSALTWTPSAWRVSTALEVRSLVRRLDLAIGNRKSVAIDPVKTAQRVRRQVGQQSAADPSDPQTWWKKSAAAGLEATIGVTGDRGVGTIRLESKSVESSVLIGGQPGSGKSVLLHALICDLVRNYSPTELNLYLLDPKEGVEFTTYARGHLPHARVVTIGAPPESTVSILTHLRKEITRRGALFNSTRTPAGTPVDNIDSYLKVPGTKPLPRVVVIIDEFQALLSGVDDDTAMKVSSLLGELIRLGRAFGIHMVLATQSLQGIRYLPSSEIDMLATRIALRMSEDDSRIFLGQNVLDAAQLSRGGQAVLHRPGIENRVVQITNETKDLVTNTLHSLSQLGPRKRGPVVLDFTRPHPPSSLSGRAIKTAGRSRELKLLAFRGLGVTEPVFVTLPTESDGHVLVVTADAQASFSTMSMMMATCAINATQFDVIDFSDLGSPFEKNLAILANRATKPGRRFARSNLLEIYLDEALAQIQQNAGSIDQGRRILFLANTHKSRELMKQGAVYDKLASLLEAGGSVGVHIVLHAGGANTAVKLIRHDLLEQFGVRISGRADQDSSFAIINSNEATKLRPHQLIAWDAVGDIQKGIVFEPFTPTHWDKF